MTQAPSKQRTLIATLGPASLDQALEVTQAGADVFRLNGSHMSPEALDRALGQIRHACPDVPVVVDLQGAKMRLGSFEPRSIAHGQSFALAHDERDSTAIPLPHAEVFRAVRAGDTLSCDDDRVHLRVEQVDGDRMRVAALADAVLRPRKGVNVLEHPVHLEDLSQTDIAQLEVARRHEHVSFAVSFMRDGHEAGWVRSRVPGARVIGKIERAEAIESLSAIAERVDALWICRGDLGAQVGVVELARWLSDFDPTEMSVPTFIAGQVLEHLTRHANPTRSEVCHLHDLLKRGYVGVVLSDETAIGVDPVHATSIASDLLRSLG